MINKKNIKIAQPFFDKIYRTKNKVVSIILILTTFEF